MQTGVGHKKGCRFKKVDNQRRKQLDNQGAKRLTTNNNNITRILKINNYLSVTRTQHERVPLLGCEIKENQQQQQEKKKQSLQRKGQLNHTGNKRKTMFDILPPLSISINADDDYSKVVLVTVLWILLWNSFSINQAFTIPDLNDPASRLDYNNKAWVLADRTFLNLTEQTPIFFCILWMHCLIGCGTDLAGNLGLIAVAARCAYPFFRTLSFYAVAPCTLTYYLCNASMQVNMISKLVYGEPLVTEFGSAVSLLKYAFPYHLLPMVLGNGIKASLAALRRLKGEEETNEKTIKKQA